MVKIKIAYDFDENEYIAFVDKYPQICGISSTEKGAILSLLYQAQKEDGWNHKVINALIEKIENEA